MSSTETQLLIHGDVDSNGLAQLLDVMRHEDALRGRVRQRPLPVGPGQMGALSDALVLTVGSGGAVGIATAIARSLNVWFVNRRSEVKLTLTAVDGTSITFVGSRIDAPELLREIQPLLEQAQKQ